jgi:acyl carrier protein
VDRVGLCDHFFELGGQSLVATRVMSRIRRELDIDVPLRKIFQAPVFEDFVASVLEEYAATLEADDLESILDEIESLELVTDRTATRPLIEYGSTT